MAKTKRTKQNRCPGRAYRNSRTHILIPGDRVKTTGLRGRTTVKRVTDEAGKRLTSVRVTADVKQVPAKGLATGIFVGRQYTGQPRSKPYPYRSAKRGAIPAIGSSGLMGRLAKAAKRVMVQG